MDNSPNTPPPVISGTAQTNPTPASPTTNGQQQTIPSNSAQGLDNNASKILIPKYLLIIILIALSYVLLNRLVPVLSFIAWIVVTIVTYVTVSKLKKSSSDQITDSDKLKAVAFMAFDPLVAQAFYYYRLRKVYANSAKSYNKLGWKVLGVEIVFYIILAISLTPLIAKK